ncbi:hypothetical protein J6590_012416 [Homalodisca vitripennis]|nr:hypothetical protein J6590_012416 [Homalodisca vitripennis]
MSHVTGPARRGPCVRRLARMGAAADHGTVPRPRSRTYESLGITFSLDTQTWCQTVPLTAREKRVYTENNHRNTRHLVGTNFKMRMMMSAESEDGHT